MVYPTLTDNFNLATLNANFLEIETNDTAIQNAINSIENRSTNCILEMPTKPTYSGLTVTVYAGTKVLIPNGRNADGTLNNIIYTVASNITYTHPARKGTRSLMLFSSGTISILTTTNFGKVNKFSEMPTTLPDTGLYRYFCEETNLWYSTTGSTTANWQVDTLFAIIATAVAEASAITSLTPYNVLKYVDTNMINQLESVDLTSTNLGTMSAHTVSRKNGVALYRLSGKCGTWTSGTSYTVTTLPFGYRPFASFDKELRLNDVFFGHLTIGTGGNVSIVPRTTISSSTIAINETFII